MTTATMTEQDYLKLVEDDPDGMWELHDGVVYGKDDGPMAIEHGFFSDHLGFEIQRQLDRRVYVVHWGSGRVRRSSSRYYIPDLIVVPRYLVDRLRVNPRQTALYPEPLPLVVEVWSPSTGGIDRRDKLPQYKQRGDLEIWFLHPYRHRLTTWVRGDDREYAETVYNGGLVRPAHLPNVVIDLDALFAGESP